MARFEITAPDGSRFEITAPDDATDDQVMAYAQQQFRQQFSARRDLKAENPAEYDPASREWQERYGPTSGMSGFDKFRAGVGMGMTNVGRGVGQAVGLVSRDDIAESRRLDAPLAQTGAGMAGNVAGAVASYLPTALIPGANTLAGAAAIGAGTGLMAPSESTGETALNTVLGGAVAPAALTAGRALPAAYQGVKSLAQPFTRSGQDQIAARTLHSFAGGRQAADDAATAMRAARPEVSGVRNTAGETANNAGIAQLERALRQNPEVSTAFTERLAENRGALLTSLQDIAGDDAALVAAERARQAAAEPLYAASRATSIAPDEQLGKLLKRPAIQQAAARAGKLVREKGAPVTNGEYLHMVKMSLDDMLETAPQLGIGKAEAGAIRTTRAEFLRWLEAKSPDYRAAREAFAAGSRPINQMQIGRDLVNKFQPALADYGADTRTSAATYARAMRDGDATAARATGFPGMTMEGVLSPEQLKTAQGVARELAKRAKADEVGKIPGSNTAQNLVSQDLLRQTLGPLGLPDSFAQGTLLQSLMRIPQFAASLGEKRVINRLADAMLDPQEAARLLQLGAKQSLPLRGLLAAEPYLPALSAGAGAGYGAQ